MTKTKTLGVRGYARHRGCAPSSVVKAITSERLTESVTRDARGRPRIDPVRADAEWQANTDFMKRPPRPIAPADVDVPDNLASAPIAALYKLRELLAKIEGPLFKCRGAEKDVKVVVTEWAKVPDLLTQLEDGMRAAHVPLYAQDMP